MVDCQADLLSHLPTRFVVPLIVPNEIPHPMARLHPAFQVDGETRLMATHLAGSLKVSELAAEIGSLARHDMEISNALDMLIIGF